MDANTFVRVNLDYLMRKARLNPSSLSVKTDVPQASIFRIIEGESKDPRTSTLQPLAAFFNVSVSDLRHKDLRSNRYEEVLHLNDQQKLWLALLDDLGSDDIDEFAQAIGLRQERNRKLMKELRGT